MMKIENSITKKQTKNKQINTMNEIKNTPTLEYNITANKKFLNEVVNEFFGFCRMNYYDNIGDIRKIEIIDDDDTPYPYISICVRGNDYEYFEIPYLLEDGTVHLPNAYVLNEIVYTPKDITTQLISDDTATMLLDAIMYLEVDYESTDLYDWYIYLEDQPNRMPLSAKIRMQKRLKEKNKDKYYEQKEN